MRSGEDFFSFDIITSLKEIIFLFLQGRIAISFRILSPLSYSIGYHASASIYLFKNDFKSSLTLMLSAIVLG